MNPKHQVFLTEVLRHGDATRAYKIAYPDAAGESLRVAANRLLHTPEIAKSIKQFHESVRSCIEQDIVAWKMDQIDTIRLKREILASIYTKAIQNHKTIPSRLYEIRDITVEPTNGEILKAIQMDNHLAEKEMELVNFEPVSVYDRREGQEEIAGEAQNVTNSNNINGIDHLTAETGNCDDTQETGVDIENFPITATNGNNPEQDEPVTIETVTNSNNNNDLQQARSPISAGTEKHRIINTVKQNNFLSRVKHKHRQIMAEAV